MILCNEKYEVLMNVAVKPPLDQCDIVHNTENINTDDYYMARIFQIHRADGSSQKIALIDLICASYEPYAVLDQNILTTILFSAIVRLDMDTGDIVRYEECENMGGLFEIHPIDGGYLIWGEGDIFRYDLSLKPVWHFMGRDILVSLYSDKHFWIAEKEIHCRDFLGWQYILDFNGKLIRDFCEFTDIETQ